MRFIIGCILFQLFYVLFGTCYLEGILDDYGNNEAHVVMYYMWDKSTDFTWALLFWFLYNTTLWNEKYYRQWLRNLIGIVAILLFIRTVCGYYVDTTKDIGLYVYMQAVNIAIISIWIISETARYLKKCQE